MRSCSNLETQLQLITAKRSPRGWRLSFVYTGLEKSADHLYVDDEITGAKPDLRSGCDHKVRLRCAKGDASEGNGLRLLTPTGEMAPRATGLSALA
jgi:hypothetical protein